MKMSETIAAAKIEVRALPPHLDISELIYFYLQIDKIFHLSNIYSAQAIDLKRQLEEAREPIIIVEHASICPEVCELIYG